METYRLWYLRQQGTVQGPFPETLICRFIILGRIGEQDEVSLDGTYWQLADNVPELATGVRNLLQVKNDVGDPEWSEERAKATLRWLDDRKSPDPRVHPAGTVRSGVDKRTGRDRRQTPETVEQHAYREWRGEFEAWLRHQRQHYGFVWLVVVIVMVAGSLFIAFNQPVNPIKVGLSVNPINCQSAPARGINLSGCVLDDTLLVGVDLRGAELIGTSMKRVNLNHADLRQADLTRANLSGADLTGARLGGAVWTDGRICAADSIGYCK